MTNSRQRFFSRAGMFLIAIVAITTLLLGRSDLYRDIAESWKLVYDVYRRVMTHYAEQIDPRKLAIAGVKGMLSELDPYSVYLEEDGQETLDLLTKGQYGGVGIQLGVRDDSLTVIAPMDDSPAKKSGILSGDRIIAVDGKSTREMSLDEAARMIRGEKGTKVRLTILRFGELEALDFDLTRAVITVEDVSYAGMIRDQIGYIRLSRFSKNSPKEIRRALLSLKEQDARKIVLDLRGNSGGLLDAAIQILDMITDKGEVLLYTKGRSEEASRQFVSQSAPIIDSSVSLAVLIDGGSASASEIIAGAVQDLDRGVIIGSRSFGKGLVQSVYTLDRDRSLKLTTAKYYVPSGRLIQKPGYVDKDLVIGWTEEDSVFSTKNGRKVTSNGGILPDIEVSPERVPALTRECWRRGLFFTFSSLYLKTHEASLPVKVDDPVLDQFSDFLSSKEITLNLKGEKQFNALKETMDSSAVQNRRIEHSLDVLEDYFHESKERLFQEERYLLALGLEREMSSILGGIGARIESAFDDDPVILKSVEVLSDQMAYNHTLNPAEF